MRALYPVSVYGLFYYKIFRFRDVFDVSNSVSDGEQDHIREIYE